jgi:GTPase
MKWRLREGEGEAIYEIGVEDSGFMAGLTAPDLKASLETLCLMAAQLGATVNVLRRREIPNHDNLQLPVRHAAEVLVRKIPDDRTSIDLRIAVLGNADVGKSTLLGVLTQGQLDNGRGRARLIMFRHLHEVQTGRTSSISHEIMGFDSQASDATCCTSSCLKN